MWDIKKNWGSLFQKKGKLRLGLAFLAAEINLAKGTSGRLGSVKEGRTWGANLQRALVMSQLRVYIITDDRESLEYNEKFMKLWHRMNQCKGKSVITVSQSQRWNAVPENGFWDLNWNLGELLSIGFWQEILFMFLVLGFLFWNKEDGRRDSTTMGHLPCLWSSREGLDSIPIISCGPPICWGDFGVQRKPGVTPEYYWVWPPNQPINKAL